MCLRNVFCWVDVLCWGNALLGLRGCAVPSSLIAEYGMAGPAEFAGDLILLVTGGAVPSFRPQTCRRRCLGYRRIIGTKPQLRFSGRNIFGSRNIFRSRKIFGRKLYPSFSGRSILFGTKPELSFTHAFPPSPLLPFSPSPLLPFSPSPLLPFSPSPLLPFKRVHVFFASVLHLKHIVCQLLYGPRPIQVILVKLVQTNHLPDILGVN